MQILLVRRGHNKINNIPTHNGKKISIEFQMSIYLFLDFNQSYGAVARKVGTRERSTVQQHTTETEKKGINKTGHAGASFDKTICRYVLLFRNFLFLR